MLPHRHALGRTCADSVGASVNDCNYADAAGSLYHDRATRVAETCRRHARYNVEGLCCSSGDGGLDHARESVVVRESIGLTETCNAHGRAGNRHGSVVKRDRCRGHGGFEATISDVVFSFGGLISGVAPALPYTHRMAVDRDVVDRPIQAVGAREHDVARHESARTVSELNNGCQPWTLRMTADDCGDVNRAQEAHAVRSLPCWRPPHPRRMRSPRAVTPRSHPAEGRHPKSIRSGAKR